MTFSNPKDIQIARRVFVLAIQATSVSSVLQSLQSKGNLTDHTGRPYHQKQKHQLQHMKPTCVDACKLVQIEKDNFQSLLSSILFEDH